MPEDFQKFYAAGADLVLTKPLKNETFIKVLYCFPKTNDKIERRKAVAAMRVIEDEA